MKRILCFMVLLILAFMAEYVRADGGFFFVEAGVGYSAEQQAILIFDPEAQRETLILSTGQDWDDPARKADYAWVVPVPSLVDREDFTTFADGTTAFEQLYQLTEPKGFVSQSCSGPFGCGARGDKSYMAGVTELVSFEVENYGIQILSAEDSHNLHRWLQDHGYAFSPQAIPMLQYYIDKNWYFTAVKVMVPDAAAVNGEGPPRQTDLLQMTFATDRLSPAYLLSEQPRDEANGDSPVCSCTLPGAST